MSRYSLLIFLAICIIAYWTKPTKTMFLDQIQSQMREEGGFFGNLVSYTVPLIGSLIYNEMTSDYYDYGLFAIFEYRDIEKNQIFLGIFGKWILLS